jgi:hypothetical protein
MFIALTSAHDGRSMRLAKGRAIHVLDVTSSPVNGVGEIARYSLQDTCFTLILLHPLPYLFHTLISV